MNEFSANLPYPEVCGSVSASTLAALMDAYGGRDSETTAILSYAYQSYVLKGRNPCLSDMLEKIAIVEMTHHERLAYAIIALGGDPIIAGRYSFFSGSYISYVKNPEDIISIDLDAERCSIDEYRRIIASTKNESIIALLSRIIMDEEIHIAALERARCALNVQDSML